MSDDFTKEEQALWDQMKADEGSPEQEEAQAETVEADASAEASDETRAEEVEQDEPQGDVAKQEAKPADPAKPPEGYVPHGALHAEREARKELQRQMQQMQERLQSFEKPAEAEPEYVDPIVDPEGFQKWATHTERKRQEETQRLQSQFEQRQQAEQMQAHVAQAENQFRQQTPDYDDAVNFMAQNRAQQLQQMGYDDQAVRGQVQEDVRNIIQAAQIMQMNPAELAYQRAQQMGYQRKAPPPAQAAQQMQARANAEQQTRGTGTGGGEQQSGRITPSQIAQMSQKEFDALPDDVRRAAMGG